MKCAGCGEEIEIGTRYIEDSPSGFMGKESFGMEDIIADLLGGEGGRIFYCEDCTEPGGDYFFETFYGDEVEA